MSKLYEIWGKHRGKYNELINSKVAKDLTSLITKVSLNNKKTTVTGKIKLNPDRENGALIGLSDITINHKFNPNHSYVLFFNGTKTTINADISLYKKENHSLGFQGLLNCNSDEKAPNSSLSALLKYDYNNNTNVMAGIESYDHAKESKPNTIVAHIAHGRNLLNGVNVYGAFISAYLLQEKHFKYQNLFIAGRNRFCDVILEFNSEKSAIQSNSELIEYDKTLGLKIATTLSPSLTVGGDTEFMINNNKLTNRLFTNFQLNKTTSLKSKWEDKDKSVTLSLNHCFQDILSLGMTGKFNMIKNENKSCKCPMPKIQSKLGFSLEINDSLI